MVVVNKVLGFLWLSISLFLFEPSMLTPHEETSDKHGEADVLVSMQNLNQSKKDEQESVDTVLPSELGWSCKMISDK